MRPRRLATIMCCLALLATPLSAAADTTPGRGVEDGDPWDRSSAPPRVLRDGTPRHAGLVGEHLAGLESILREGLEPQLTPVYPGAIALVAGRGMVADRVAVGHALRWADPDTELPPDEWLPMREDTIFDVASISKLFTAVAVLQLAEEGLLGLEDAVADHLPAFGANGKQDVTVEQLLVHTSGLPAWAPLHSAYPDRESRIAAVMESELASAPGAEYVYSDLGLIVLGELVEALAGAPLDEVVAARITEPLGMDDTGYNPDPALRVRIAATEYQPEIGRGLVHGEVHDENAWSLGGVSGHAGIFSTADDLGVFAQMLLNGGRYRTARILSADTVAAMMRDYTGDLGAASRGLGPELAARFYHDAMTTPHSAGHTGFTGTSLVIDPHTDTFAILLTNRVHPSRDWEPVASARREVARATARSVPVRPPSGEAWFSGIGDDLDHTLGVELDLPADATLELDLWFDVAPDDALAIEASDDGGETWQRLAGTLHRHDGAKAPTDGLVTGWGLREWWSASFPLHDLTGEVELRAHYTTDAGGTGRGVYLDRIKVRTPDTTVFDDRRPKDHAGLSADGWTLSTN